MRILGKFHRRASNLDQARRHLEAGRQKTSTPFDRERTGRWLFLCM
ncbi:hypothetical protein [Fimbriiglobus ruber]|uniref:Uncharacterized protein n=1 Tax=Fimbriiglobus ruber TaxID=1908690 RepID=A0A225DKB4_9BACT|nr:hypothetical protein [Fimbriiglobus ruber]OWK36815.1 hypothetical protein FRUB_09378 [Fimbriiglobus ruber]